MRQILAAFMLSAAFLCPSAMPSAQASEAVGGAQEPPELLRLDALARVDWQNTSTDGRNIRSNSGFEGKYLMIRLDGRITEGLTYSWRQRFNKQIFDSSFFDATDWLYLNYSVAGWNFQAATE